MVTIQEEIGARIKAVRAEMGLTQAELGKTLSISKSSISCYESGSHDTSPGLLTKISALSGKSLEWLITGNEPCQSSAAEERQPSIVREPESDYSPEIQNVLDIMKFNPKAYTLTTAIIPGFDSLPDDLQSETVRKVLGIINDAEEKAKQRAGETPTPKLATCD